MIDTLWSGTAVVLIDMKQFRIDKIFDENV